VKKSFTYEFKSGKVLTKDLPMRNEVCGRCDGEGTHLRPGMEGRAYSWEEFQDDPEFEEGYFGGRYDVVCDDCHGRNVMPVVDEEALTHSQARFWSQVCRVSYEQAEREAADRMQTFMENGGYWGS